MSDEITQCHVLLNEYGISKETADGKRMTLAERIKSMSAYEVTSDDQREARTLITYGQVRTPFLDAILLVFRNLRKPWAQLSEVQQADLIASVRSKVDAYLDRAVRVAVASNLPTVTAELGDFTIKKDEIAGKFKAARTQAYLEKLGAHGTKPIHIILSDPRLLDDGTAEQKVNAEPDQGRMDDLLDYPADNSDLANAGDDADDTEGDK